MESVKQMLRRAAERHKKKEIVVKTDDEYFHEEYCKVFPASASDPTKSLIPSFYPLGPGLEALMNELDDPDECLRLKLREEARGQLLQRRSKELLDKTELKMLYSILEANSSPSLPEDNVNGALSPGEALLDYDQYKEARAELSQKCQAFLTAATFAKLQHGDPKGRISVMALFNYVMRKVWLHQTRIGLSVYDTIGQGYLKEPELESYIAELIETLPQVERLDKSFHSFYVCTSVRKFFFFLDPMHTGRIKISDLLACSFLDDFLELREQDAVSESGRSNWFSAPSVQRVYTDYINLDTDHNGMLNRDELLLYGTRTLTPAFIDRVFQQCLTYGGEMDYKTYLDFVLALENRKEPQALMYFFRILDVNQRGYLDAFSLNYFFRDIIKQMQERDQDPVRFEDVKDEIFDMVRPVDPLRITLTDLIKCGHGDTVVSILIDLNGFWNYENREMMAPDHSNQSTS